VFEFNLRFPGQYFDKETGCTTTTGTTTPQVSEDTGKVTPLVSMVA
jgi:hypothetical protein